MDGRREDLRPCRGRPDLECRPAISRTHMLGGVSVMSHVRVGQARLWILSLLSSRECLVLLGRRPDWRCEPGPPACLLCNGRGWVVQKTGFSSDCSVTGKPSRHTSAVLRRSIPFTTNLCCCLYTILYTHERTRYDFDEGAICEQQCGSQCHPRGCCSLSSSDFRSTYRILRT